MAAMAAAILAVGLQAAPSIYLPDRSLTAAKYVELGVPAPDRAWSPSDYSAAVEVLRRVRGEDPARLPRYGSASSGVVFVRLVSDENLAVLASGDTPVAGRLGIASEFLGSAKQVLLLYLEPSTSNVVLDDEMAEISGFMLRLWAQFYTLLSDPTAGTNREALERAGSIIAGYVSSVLDSIADVGSFRAPARAQLASHLGDRLPAVWPALSPLQRSDFRSHLQRVANGEGDAKVRGRLREISSRVPTSE
jgi:hypothetical protein